MKPDARALGWAGLAVLALAWLGPLPALVPQSVLAHMLLHMTVVGLGAPLLATGLVPFLGMRWRTGAAALAVAASVLDLVVIWSWHTPVLHHLSRTEPLMLVLEQASFASVALLVWVVAFAGPPFAGALTLFFTSMHMTLLGALIALSQRTIFAGHGSATPWLGLTPVADQQIGGTVMLTVGAIVYITGGLILAARGLRREALP